MNYIIIEDEFLAAQLLEKKIKEIRPKWHCVAKLESVLEASEYLSQETSFDLIFCDIHLSDGLSFEIFEKITVSQPLIFTTAFDKYAIEAFKVHSIHYLLKPIKDEQLKEAIEKFENQKEAIPQKVNMEALLKASEADSKTRFLVKKGQNMKVIPVEEVAYFYSKSGLTHLVCTNTDSFLINDTLDYLEAKLNPKEFYRANRQYIIHIQSIKVIEPYFKGKLFVHLQPEQTDDCVISQAKAGGFKEWLNEK